MRSMLVFTMTMAQLLLATVSFAATDSYDDCRTSCAADRQSRDMDCPSPYDSARQSREQCLQASRETYQSCVNSCPPPSPSPAESNPSTMGY